MSQEQEAWEAPRAFLSYSWDSSPHKEWVKGLATRLRGDGVDVTLDHWSLVPGDKLPEFMERAIRENSYVIIICTPNYKAKSDQRKGGVGYEGDIMTGEVLNKRNDREFIPVLRSDQREASLPSWLIGKYSIDLSGDPYSELQYTDLLQTLHNRREQAPPLGRPTVITRQRLSQPPTSHNADEFQPIRIEGVLADEVGRPRNDGSRGSALYAVPFKLSLVASAEWEQLFVQAWNYPPQFTTMHRPGTAEVHGDRIVLTRTTMEEVRDVHRETLKLAVDQANRGYAEWRQKKRAAQEARARAQQEHTDSVRRIADEIKFD